MVDINKEIKNSKLTASGRIVTSSNTPISASSKQNNIWGDATATYYNEFGKYATNVFDAEIQGLDYSDFYAWRKVKIRSSLMSEPTIGNELSQSWQKIYVLDKNIDALRNGAYVKYNNATWIIFNANNVGTDIPTAIVQRCNTTFSVLDYYGNIVQIPIVYTKGMTLSAEPFYHQYSIMPDGYEHILLQYNEYTKNFNNNTRIILGKSAFVITGIVDFAQDYTGDKNSVHMLRADVRATTVESNDDIENGIADCEEFTMNVVIGGNGNLVANQQQQFTVDTFRNNKKIESTTEHPLTYTWSTSNSSVATVSSSGLVTAVGSGECNIYVSVNQNININDSIKVKVEQAITDDRIVFTTPIPNTMDVFDTIEVEAYYYEDGIKTSEPIVFTIQNAVYVAEANKVTITASKIGTITLTATHGYVNKTATITVQGF